MTTFDKHNDDSAENQFEEASANLATLSIAKLNSLSDRLMITKEYPNKFILGHEILGFMKSKQKKCPLRDWYIITVSDKHVPEQSFTVLVGDHRGRIIRTSPIVGLSQDLGILITQNSVYCLEDPITEPDISPAQAVQLWTHLCCLGYGPFYKNLPMMSW